MASYGSLLFFKRNGVSEPFSLSYGKTTIGSSDSHHIRIKGEGQISCILDSNEVGVTILVNENEDKNILINNEPTRKYTVMKNGDQLEVGKKKFKYSHPSLKEEYLEQTQQTLNKKVGNVDNVKTKSEIDLNPPTPSKRLQKVSSLSKQRRFSTGSKFATAKNSPKIIGKSPLASRHTSTPQSPAKARFSRRMVARRNSTLACVMENEDFVFQSPKTTPVSKTRHSFVTALNSPSAKKNKTLPGSSKFSSPVPAKRRTYSGNISDVSESITTPENSVTVASITPLNVSKKKSLNRSRTMSYVDFPSSSTPKSAIKMNRSSSLYRPLVEDITPASPLPRSSLRNSSLKKASFTQRRSVNFDISSSSDRSPRQDSDSIGGLEASSSRSKRKSSMADLPELSGSTKKRKSNSSKVSNDDNQEDQNSLHDSSISGIQNLSDTSFNSSKNESTNISTASKFKRNVSFKDKVDLENQSVVSWNMEVSSTDMNISNLSEVSSIAETPLKGKRSLRLSKSYVSTNSVEKTRSLSRTSFKGKTQQEIQDDDKTNSSRVSNLGHLHSRRSSLNVSPSNLESVLNDSLDVYSEDLKSASSRTRRSSIKIQEKKRGKIRSKSLNLTNVSKESANKLSKTLGSNLMLNNTSQDSNLEHLHSRRSSFNVSPSNLESDLNDSFDVSSEDLKSVSSRTTRSSIKIQEKKTGKTRSKSLNLTNDTKESANKLSKTLGSNFMLNHTSQDSNLEHLHSRRSSLNVSPSNLESVLNDSLDVSLEDLKSASSRTRRSSIKIQEKKRGKIRSKSLNLTNDTKESANKLSKTLGSNLMLTNTSQDSNLEHLHSRRSSFNVSPSNLESDLNDSFDVSSEDLKSVSSRTTRSSIKIQEKKREKTRSKSLNLTNDTKESVNKLSKTLGSNLMLNKSEQKSLRNISSTPTVPTKSRSVYDKRKSSISKPRSRSLNVRNKLSNSLHVLPKSSSSMTLDFSPILSSSSKIELLGENATNESDSFVSAASPSASSSMLADSISELNDSVELSESMYNIGDTSTPGTSKQKSVSKTPIIAVTMNSSNNKKIGSPASSRMSLRSRSLIVSDTASEYSSVSNDMSFNSSLQGVNLDRTDSSGVLFKTPNVKRAPRKLETPNRSFQSTNDPTNIKSIEEMLNETFEKSTRRSTRSSNVSRESFTDVDDPESVETSLSRSWKSVGSGNIESLKITSPRNLSAKVSIAKLTPRSIKHMTEQQKTPVNDLTEIAGVEELLNTSKVLSPKNDLGNVSGMKKLLKQQKIQNSPKNDLSEVVGVKKLMATPRLQKAPKNDLTNIVGVKNLLKTPKVQKSPRNDLTNIGGIKKLLKTPKVQKSPKNDLSNVGGVKKLLKTPKVQKSPRNDLSNVGGLKKIMKTPKVQKSPKNDLTNVGGVKRLMRTPKVQKSPKNDLTNVGGVKKLMNIPKVQKSPKNDLTNVGGVKKLMNIRKVQKSPKNDLTNVGGVKKLMTTPKLQKSPKNDLTKVSGLKKLMTSPKQQKSPKNDLTNVKGMKNILKTPRAQKSPKNDLLDVRGIRNLLRTPKNKAADESHDLSGIDILFDESQESNFDKLLDKKPPRTYGRSPNANKSQEQQLEKETPEHVLKWLEEQSKLEPTTQIAKPKVGKRKLAKSSDTPNKRPTNKDESMLNISSTIHCKPSSTPKGNEKIVQHTSKGEIPETSTQTNKKDEQQIGSRAARGKRKLENNDKTDDEPSLKKTRGRKPRKNDSEDNNTNENQVKSPVDKNTRKTRQAKQIDDEQPPKESKTRQLRGRKQNEINKDLINDENSEKIEEKETKKQTRGKKVTEKRIPAEEESSEIIKNTRSRRGQVQEEIANIVDETAPNRRGKSNKQKEVEQENTNVDDEQEPKRTTRKNKKIEEIEKSVEIEDKPEPTGRGRRNKKVKNEEVTTVIESVPEPKKRGRKKKEVEEKGTDIQNEHKPNKRAKDSTETEEDSVVIENDSSSGKKGKNSKQNETLESKEIEDKPEPTGRGRRNKVKNEEVTTVIESVPEPKKRGRKKKEVEEKGTDIQNEHKPNKRAIDSTETEEESVLIENDSSSAKKGKNSKQNETQESKDESEPTSKKRTRRTKIEDTNSEKKDEPEQPIKKSIRRMKTDDTNSEEKEQTRTTRSNKGKNKKYNDEEWDTPVKKTDKKQTVTFKEGVEYLQTPAESNTDGVRSLRKKRNAK